MHRSTCTMTGHQRVSCRAHHGLKSGIAARITRGPSYVTARPTRIGAIRIPLYSTLSALCYNSMPIPRFQSVPRLCLFYAWLPVCQSPQGIMPGHHLTHLPPCLDKDWDPWLVSFPICLSTLSATVLCLAVRQVPAGHAGHHLICHNMPELEI